MTRLEAAVVELVAALREEVVPRAPEDAAPERLLAVNEARQALGGISRSTLYDLIARDEIRTLTIGRRRCVPYSSVAAFIHKAVPPQTR